MLNYYLPFYSTRQGRHCPGVSAKELTKEKFYELTRSEEVKKLIASFRNGDAEAKQKLPAVCWTGTLPKGGKRKASDMQPTGLFMVDIDHCEYPNEAWENIQKTMREIKEQTGYDFMLMLVHITPSGMGLRLVLKCTESFPTLTEHMVWINDRLNLSMYGDFDECVHDISRISFLPQFEDILFIDNEIFNAPFNDGQCPIVQEGSKVQEFKNNESQKVSNGDRLANSHAATQPNAENSETSTKEEDAENPILWLGHDVQEIIDRMFAKALPCKEKSNRHESSLKLASDLLVLLDGDKKTVEELLRRQSWVKEIIAERNEDVAGTVNSATQRKTKKEGESLWQGVSRKMNAALKALYGKTYYEIKKEQYADEIDEQQDVCEDGELQGEETEKVVRPVSTMPTPPPVIRELISIAPEDFVIPAINSLLPILGTLTSYVRSEDRQNGKVFSTSFFSVIYAPPSSGKSFMERYINYLLHNIMLRDEVNDARDAVYARSQQTKSANDKGEKLPQTSVRIMEAKNSEAEFLEKQRNNQGHHMFTYCAEIDQWRKGIRAAGGNKDDMVRIAWDNGIYGQNYKSANTFKGKVQLFWNVLLAGTDDQVAVYFKNVTNGLVTRCSFTHIDNQQFQEVAPQWKKLSKKDMKKVDDFLARCEMNTYTEPFTYNPQDAYLVDDKDFDSEVPWHFSFKPLQYIDVDWINSTVNKFQKEQCRKAMIDNDEARDTFRRRVGDRGKRIALLCTQLYGKPMTDKDKKACAKWIGWWMEQDLNAICKTFGSKYQQAMQETALPDGTHGKTILERLPDEFKAEDVRRVADILGYKQKTRSIISNWVKAGVVEKFAKDRWRKIMAGS